MNSVYSISTTSHMALRKNAFFPQAFAVLLALLPIFLPYAFPFASVSFSSVLCVFLSLWAVPIAFINFSKIKLWPLFFLVVFFVYAGTKSGGIDLFSLIIVFVILVSLSTGYIDAPFLRKAIECIAILASFAVIFQTLLYRALGFHLPLVIANLCTPAIRSQYLSLINSGIAADSTYRPSAFFLEPAHFSQFCIFGLSSCLFRSRPKWIHALIISVGIVLTTSGMGAVMALGAWAAWLILYNYQYFKKNIIRFVLIALAALLLLLVFYQLPALRYSIGRIFGENGMSSIKGRTFYWESYFGGFSVSDLMFGFGKSSIPEGPYFTGFMTYLWAYGIIGFALYTLGCLQIFLSSKFLSKFLVLICFSLVFFANQTNLISMTFSFGVIIALKNESRANAVATL